MAFTKATDKTAALKEALKGRGTVNGAWLLCGEESYLSAHYLTLLRKKMIPDPEMGYFDHIRLNGNNRSEETLAAQVQRAVAGLPVINEGKLIEIAEPNFYDMSAADLNDFCTVVESLSSYPYAAVVIRCAEEEFPTDFRTATGAVWKSLEKAGVHIVPFERQTAAKLIPWCKKHFASEGIDADPTVIDAMIARVGTSMAALSGEMEKLCWYAKMHARTAVLSEDVMHICTVTEQAENFGISSAVRARDTAALMREYIILKDQKTDAMLLFFQISAAITELWKVKIAAAEGYIKEEMMKRFKMKEYPMRLAIQGAGNYSQTALDRLMHLCAETDIKLKSSGGDGYLLVERLICEVGKSTGL